jgi:hypothetical protein
MVEITPEERQQLEQEERNLICDLSAAVSDTGDYRMIRCVDALILSDKFWDLIDGIELPYSREELTGFARARQAKRDRIKEIREILEE